MRSFWLGDAKYPSELLGLDDHTCVPDRPHLQKLSLAAYISDMTPQFAQRAELHLSVGFA